MTPEGQVLRAVLDYLAARHIFAMRMNTGAVASEYNGKKRFIRFGTPGCADVLAFTDGLSPVWIECKAAKGKQTAAQKSFQKRVEDEGHWYILARSVEDVMAVLA